MNGYKKVFSIVYVVFFLCLTSLVGVEKSYSFVSEGVNIAYRLSKNIIIDLAKVGTKNGSKALRTKIYEVAKNLPETEKVAFFEGTLVRVLQQQGRLSKNGSDEILRNLSGVKGFVGALSKSAGMSDAKAAGHLYEVKVANALVNNKFKVIEIGKSFKYPAQKGITDIDIVATKGKKEYVFEIKNYSANSFDANTMINFRNDMQTLSVYSSQGSNIEKIMIISHEPRDIMHSKLLNAYAMEQNIKLIYASEQELHAVPLILN